MNLSLNDAAALLIQIEPDDVSELANLQELLNTIAENKLHSEAFREKIVQAVQIIGDIINSSVSESSSALTEIGKLIEAAMNMMEENTEVFSGDSGSERTGELNDESTQDVFADSEIVLPGSDDTKEDGANDVFVDSEITLPDYLSADQEDESTKNDPATSSDKKTTADYLPESADPDLIGAFITESNDLIANAEEALLLLENDPDDMDAVSTVFRAFHTVKGTSGFLELSLVSEIAHHAESFLSRIRDREIRYEGAYTDLALRSVDILKELLSSVQGALGGKPLFKPPDYDDLMHLLANPEKAEISPEYTELSDMKPVSAESEPQIADILANEPSAEEELPDEEVLSDEDLPEGEDLPEEELPDEEFPDEEELPDEKELSEEEEPGEEADEPGINQTEKPEMASGKDAAQEHRVQPRTEGARQIAESSVRVPVERLDRFIDMVGELVVAHSMVAQDEVIVNGSYHELMKKVTQTGKIVRELQSMSMSMRMIPLKATFLKMARLVRDLARRAGKNVSFITDGEDTEIDRNMVDVINDPLVHMVRNAVDHGIEPPDIRKKLSKPMAGIVQISACHSAGNVMVEIKDDGRGLDREAILAKAVERGLVSEESADVLTSDRENILSDQDVFSLIFEPGFSTSEIISDISGRGVGMDVVKTNIEKLRGQIEIQSRPGEGTVFKISLPLTLAIIDGMVLRVGSERYVMPTASIVRSVQPALKDISTVVRKGEVLSLQGKLIPLFRLSRLFQIQDAEDDLTRAIIMVVEDDGRQAGLVIDELIGTQQIVIKTLGEIMRNIVGISGSAIMPDGRVGLILDVGGLVKLANTD